MLNSSKKVFVLINCVEEHAVMKSIWRSLNTYRIPRENVINGINMEFASGGDYIIRCIGGTLAIFEIETTFSGNMVTKLIGYL